MSKIVQSGIIHRASSRLGILAHVVMTPNVFGGNDAPSSLLGSMRQAIQAKEVFRIKNPSTKKRFAHVRPFTSYIMALLQDIEIRTRAGVRSSSFEVSSMDFVPVTTVGCFAKQQWTQLGGDPRDLICGQ
jgi:nucleoside-diphosphate-sugar epimerase